MADSEKRDIEAVEGIETAPVEKRVKGDDADFQIEPDEDTHDLKDEDFKEIDQNNIIPDAPGGGRARRSTRQKIDYSKLAGEDEEDVEDEEAQLPPEPEEEPADDEPGDDAEEEVEEETEEVITQAEGPLATEE